MTERSWREWLGRHGLAWALVLVVSLSLLRSIQALTWRVWFNTMDFVETPSFVLFQVGWFAVMSVGLIGVGIVWTTRTSWRELGWKKNGLVRSVGLGVLAFVLMSINVLGWSLLGGAATRPEPVSFSAVRLLLVMFFAFGMAAWVEENLFRGFLQMLLVERIGLWKAVLLQAILFSVAHLGWTTRVLDFGSAFVSGLILGGLRGRKGSLVAPYVAHALLWMMAGFGPPSL